MNYIGNYDYYLEKKDELTAVYAGPDHSPGIASSGNVSESKLSWQEQKEIQAKERKRLNELKKTEERITELEERDAAFDETISLEGVFPNSVSCQELPDDEAAIAVDLEHLYQRWQEHEH